LTLPTGVSTFLLECLDVDSTADYNAGSNDSMNNCSSPETFRHEDDSDRSNLYPEDCVKYKNSTLLDSSKAMTIDKVPQISNLSAILEPVLEDFQDQYTRRNKPSKCNYSSSELNVSTTLAGKQVCKITAARERTPGLKTGMRCSSPKGPERKPDNQTAKPKKLECKKKAKFSSPLEGVSSFSQLESAPESTSAKSVELTAQVLPSKQPDAMPPYNREEMCSIVRTSPGQKSSRLHQIPVNRNVFCLPKGVPEDTITSTKNWVYNKHR
ncbi:hypothetical protein N308_05298, partial [Struthio camelus australis]